MKHFILTMTACALLIGMSACGGEQENAGEAAQESGVTQETAQASFYCPMKCEGEKTYAEMGDCPVCGMDLVSVDDDANADAHEGHDHESHDGHEH